MNPDERRIRYQSQLDQLLSKEPHLGEDSSAFSHHGGDERALTIRGLIRQQWRLATVGLLLVLTIAAADQAGPRLVAVAIDRGMVERRDMALITTMAGLYLGAVVVTALCQRWLLRASGRLGARVMEDVRRRVFSHLQRLSVDFYTREKAGVVMARMTSDVENLQQFVQDGLPQVAVQVLTMLIIAAMLLSMDAQLAVVTMLLTLPALLLATAWFQRTAGRAYLRVRDGSSAVLTHLTESLRGRAVVAANNRQAYNVAQHREISGDYQDANDAAALVAGAYAALSQLVGLLSQVLLLAVGGRMVLDDSLSIGELVAFFLYYNRFFQPLQHLVQQFTSYTQSRASFTKLNALLAEAPSVVEASDAVELPTVSGEIRFQNVCFRYDGSRAVLDDIDLTLRAGQRVALVGPTGAGKSTLAKLVNRMHDATTGHVLVDGNDVRGVTLSSLRRQVSLVPQEVFLFAGTIRDNVAFGRPRATDVEVLDALAMVGLDDALRRLPLGLDTPVMERGAALSAGERQLVALARALLATPRVVLLDEATANLDLRSESRVEMALDRVLQGRTAIVVAHRLSTAMNSDRVVVLERGRVVEDGPPQQLLDSGGRFAQLHQTWSAHLPVR